MKKLVVYIHGKGGSADEAGHYKALFPQSDVMGFDYKAQTPWEAAEEFPAYMAKESCGYDDITLIANSIGAYFSLCSLEKHNISRAFLISPVADMEKLICNMMTWANVTEAELQERKVVDTAFGDSLSWEYLCYVRQHPIKWDMPTHILYGEKDELTDIETIRHFAKNTGATLDIMEGGEHWFHTKEQMEYLDKWIRKYNNE
ncbi:MAG: alpha/beta hydrolase [Ruminococcus sp.]|nr:alpha/beta hydrolase [Ruminococcus sp.]